MIGLHSHHFQREDLDDTLIGQSEVFGLEGRVTSSFETNHLADSQCTGAQYRPHFLFIKDLFLLYSLLDFFLERVVEVFIEEGYLVEGGAKSVLQFGVCPLEVEDVLVLFGKLFGEVYEGLLIGLLVGKGIFLDEMETAVLTLAYDGAVRNLTEWNVFTG